MVSSRVSNVFSGSGDAAAAMFHLLQDVTLDHECDKKTCEDDSPFPHCCRRNGASLRRGVPLLSQSGNDAFLSKMSVACGDRTALSGMRIRTRALRRAARRFASRVPSQRSAVSHADARRASDLEASSGSQPLRRPNDAVRHFGLLASPQHPGAAVFSSCPESRRADRGEAIKKAIKLNPSVLNRIVRLESNRSSCATLESNESRRLFARREKTARTFLALHPRICRTLLRKSAKSHQVRRWNAISAFPRLARDPFRSFCPPSLEEEVEVELNHERRCLRARIRQVRENKFPHDCDDAAAKPSRCPPKTPTMKKESSSERFAFEISAYRRYIRSSMRKGGAHASRTVGKP